MPVRRGHDSHGSYYSYGPHGARYYYTTRDTRSRERAKAKAALQGRAIESRRRR